MFVFIIFLLKLTVDARMNVWRDLVLRDGNVALTAAADWPKCLATTAESWAI